MYNVLTNRIRALKSTSGYLDFFALQVVHSQANFNSINFMPLIGTCVRAGKISSLSFIREAPQLKLLQ